MKTFPKCDPCLLHAREAKSFWRKNVVDGVMITLSSSFSENVEVAETSYQMLVVLSFFDRERV